MFYYDNTYDEQFTILYHHYTSWSEFVIYNLTWWWWWKLK